MKFTDGFEKVAVQHKDLKESLEGHAKSKERSALLNMLGGSAIGLGVGAVTGMRHTVPIGALMGLARARHHNHLRNHSRDVLLMPEKERREALDKLDPDKHWLSPLSKSLVQEGKRLRAYGAD